MARSVVIAGGGISGLALAWALRLRGIGVRVFEPARRAGGKLQSDRVDGFLVENGPQAFGFRDPAARSLVEGLGLGTQLVTASDAARRRCVLVGGELREVPLSPLSFALSRAAPAGAKARLLLDLALPRGAAARGGDESVAAFGRRRFGARAAEQLFFPLVSGLYSGDPEVLSLPAAFPTLARLERESRSVLLGAWRAQRAAAQGPRLASFREGVGTLALALAARLGDELELGVGVSSVRRVGSGWRVGVEGDRHRELDCDAVVLAMPAHAAGAVVGGVEPAVAAIVGRIPYAPVVMVHLGYRSVDVPRLPQAYGFYAPSSEPSRLLGAVFTSAIFPSHAPPGAALIACRMGGAREPGLLGLSDDELGALAHQELVRLIGAAAGPVFRRVVRHPRALPQYTLGHAERVEAIDAAVRRHPGLFLSGNAYRGLGILDCLRSAEALAARIAEHLSWPFKP